MLQSLFGFPYGQSASQKNNVVDQQTEMIVAGSEIGLAQRLLEHYFQGARVDPESGR